MCVCVCAYTGVHDILKQRQRVKSVIERSHWRSHWSVTMTDGRKSRERQKEPQMKRGMSRGQAFERNKCV